MVVRKSAVEADGFRNDIQFLRVGNIQFAEVFISDSKVGLFLCIVVTT